MSNPRIYIVIATFHPIVGGAEKQALAQCRNIRERGYEASVITFRHNNNWPHRETIDNVPVLRVAGRLLGGREKFPRFLQRLLYVLALITMGWTLWSHRHHYDVLHLHQFTMLALPAALVCWLANKALVVVVHSAGLGVREPVRDNLSLVAGPLDSSLPWLRVDALLKAGGDLANLQLLGNFGMHLTRILLQRIRAVPVVISSRMRGYLAAYDFDLPGTQLIPNGVDINRFHPDDTVPIGEERARTVICVARLDYEKGIDVLLQAWRLIQQQVPNLKAHLVIVGGGSLERQLKLIAQELGIADSVEFAGIRSDISTQWHRGSLAVLPSRWEGMPVAVLEAMACGLPCVATRVSGSEDIIQHEVNGLLVESEDYEGMAQAILILLHDPELIKKYGKAARSTIEIYSLEHIIDMYVELYLRIVGHKQPVSEARSSSKNYQSSL